MKQLILGATGGIGLEIVRQAIDRGHQVTAFVRTPGRLKDFVDRIAVIQGDVLNSAELEQALEGQDVVLSCFGARKPRSTADADLYDGDSERTSGRLRSGVVVSSRKRRI
jgi:putative NADH-flavin reductase